ncbi:programmed cell death 6-interacting protein [Ischnura elegans]|uniref:programmed cell death 6-interacting protein n=1 Tax=Ischnura elegans TaxID=197161 RepID=UPI001ED88BF4|nr:programmed cell death 6-interacting protein [Ischnura elegans]
MAGILAVPLKKPSDVDVIKPLKNFLSSTYSSSNNQEDYSDAVNEFSKLRISAIWRAFEKNETALEMMNCYYDQLTALECKVPPNEIQIPFKWKDAFDKSSLFGGRLSLTIASLSFEKVCVLFNIAALQSSIAAAQSVESDEGLKLAAKLLQQAAGIFSHLKGCVMPLLQQNPTPDLNPETLGALSSLMMAQAQEIFVLKAIHDNMKDMIIAKLSSQCVEMYDDVAKQLQKEALRSIWDRDWINTVCTKQGLYQGIADYHKSLVCRDAKEVGEEIARLEVSLSAMKTAQQSTIRNPLLQDYVNKAKLNLAEAKKNNDFIYHDRIPDPKSLPPIGKFCPAKATPLPDRFSTSFTDLFAALVPVAVHQAMAAYDAKKNEIVNAEVLKLRESTQLLNSILASLNLPAAIEETPGGALPQSLCEKADYVRSANGIEWLDKMIKDLPDLLQRNQDILDEADRMLRDENESDSKLRSQFGDRWSRTPSVKLTETFRSNSEKYRKIISNAVEADKSVREKFEKHRAGIELLSRSMDQLNESVPTGGPSNTPQASQGAVAEMRKLMEEVEAVRAERDTIEWELKSASTDMKDMFLSALGHEGKEPGVEELHRTYGPLQKRVQESISRQETLLENIQRVNQVLTQERSSGSGQREEVLKQLAAAFDAFKELESNLKEGTKFYNDLTQLLVGFQNKVSDYCFARKTEKEELLKDLTQTAGRDTTGGQIPGIPSHHGASAAGGARAPPEGVPTASAPGAPNVHQPTPSLPYPIQPQGMPMPYATMPAYGGVPMHYFPTHYQQAPAGYPGYPGYAPPGAYGGYPYPQQPPHNPPPS